MLALRHRHPLGAVHRLDQLVADTRQQVADDLAIVLGVLDDEDALAHSAASIISSTRTGSGASRITLQNNALTQRTQRTRGGRRRSEAIDHPRDAVAHMRDMKIQQRTELKS